MLLDTAGYNHLYLFVQLDAPHGPPFESWRVRDGLSISPNNAGDNGSLKLVMGSVSNPGTFNGVFVTKKALGMASEIMDTIFVGPLSDLRSPRR
jgi:hypothetical protein